MAQKVLVQFVDDLDGTSSTDVSTVHFGLDGVEYEIDLAETNAEQLRKAFADYVASARRTGGRLKRGAASASKPGGTGEAGQIREWALDNGIELAARGRIPSHVVDAYTESKLAAEAKPKAATKGVAKRRTAAKKA
jgi:hypothetical protein